ncbi:MAG: hypothetical protein AABW80_04760 [Nanoarchaeota archaeon]
MDMRKLNDRDFGLLTPVILLARPNIYFFESTEDFNDARKRGVIKPIRRPPWFLDSKYNGLALLGFRNNLRFNFDEDEGYYLADFTGSFTIHFPPVISNSRFNFEMHPESLAFLRANPGALLKRTALLYNPSDEKPNLVSFDVANGESRERFGCDSFGLDDSIGFG